MPIDSSDSPRVLPPSPAARWLGPVAGVTTTLGSLLGTLSPCANAYQIVASGGGSAVQEASDNLFLTPGPHRGVWGQGFDANADLEIASSNWESRLAAGFASRWYLGESNLDYHNQQFSAASQYRWSERSTLGLAASYNLDSTLTSLADATSSIGYVFQRLRRRSRGLTPSWVYLLDEKTKLTTSYGFQDSVYEKSAASSGRVVDSTAHSGSLALEHQLTERIGLSGIAAVSSSDLDFPQSIVSLPAVALVRGLPVTGTLSIRNGGIGTIRSESLSAGFRYDFSESLRLGFSGGVQFNQVANASQISRFQPNSPQLAASTRRSAVAADTVSEILNADITKKLERGELGFRYSKSVSPNLLGTLLATDLYEFSGRYELGTRVSSTVKVALSETSPDIGGAGKSGADTFQRSFLNVSAALTWKLTENLSLVSGYQYGHLELPFSDQQAQGHSAYLRVQYALDKYQF